MELRLESRTTWDPGFFPPLVALANRLHADNAFAVHEHLKDLSRCFAPDSAFARNNTWEVFAAYRGNKLVGRVSASLPTYWENPRFVPVGFFECENDVDAAHLLFDAACRFAARHKVDKVKGPIQGSFFLSYRLRAAGQTPPFYGEPMFPGYYHALFEQAGFAVEGQWETRASSAREVCALARDHLVRGRKVAPAPTLTFRRPDLRNWNQELRLVRRLFLDSYASMPNFMPISVEEFVEFYDSFRYVLDTKLSCFVEHEGKTVGFMVGYRDPLSLLLETQRARYPFKKLVALWRLRSLKTRILLPYVGKSSNAAALRFVLPQMLLETLSRFEPENPQVLACYLSEDSPAKAAVPEGCEVIAKYVLYAKDITQSP